MVIGYIFQPNALKRLSSNIICLFYGNEEERKFIVSRDSSYFPRGTIKGEGGNELVVEGDIKLLSSKESVKRYFL